MKIYVYALLVYITWENIKYGVFSCLTFLYAPEGDFLHIECCLTPLSWQQRIKLYKPAYKNGVWVIVSAILSPF